MRKNPEYFNSADRPVIAADIFAREDPEDDDEEEGVEDEDSDEEDEDEEGDEGEGYSE